MAVIGLMVRNLIESNPNPEPVNLEFQSLDNSHQNKIARAACSSLAVNIFASSHDGFLAVGGH